MSRERWNVMCYESDGDDVFVGWLAEDADGCFLRIPSLGVGRRFADKAVALRFVRERCGLPGAYLV